MNIQVELPEVKLGVAEADGVRVAPAGTELARHIEQTCDRIRREFSVESLAESEPTREVRAMFRAWGMDPSKYRPSSEALQRRVVQGKGLYFVSNVVDIGNLGSIETAWPFGCYDRACVHSPVVFRKGTAGERYDGIGKRVWHLEGRPVLADAEGPFGSPISDSTRSMVAESTRDILTVIYAPASASDASIEGVLARLSERLVQFGGASATRVEICR